MRVLPYRTLDNYISGAVITFTDITALKTLESQLQESTRFAESIVESMREPLLVLDAGQRVLAIGGAFAQLFGLDAEVIKGQPLRELDGGAWQQPAPAVSPGNPRPALGGLCLRGRFPGGRTAPPAAVRAGPRQPRCPDGPPAAGRGAGGVGGGLSGILRQGFGLASGYKFLQ